jgi:hypothetical protein
MRIVNSSEYSGGVPGPTIVSTYQERKMSVLEIEQADPARFLRAFGNYNRTRRQWAGKPWELWRID